MAEAIYRGRKSKPSRARTPWVYDGDTAVRHILRPDQSEAKSPTILICPSAVPKNVRVVTKSATRFSIRGTNDQSGDNAQIVSDTPNWDFLGFVVVPTPHEGDILKAIPFSIDGYKWLEFDKKDGTFLNVQLM